MRPLACNFFLQLHLSDTEGKESREYFLGMQTRLPVAGIGFHGTLAKVIFPKINLCSAKIRY